MVDLRSQSSEPRYSFNLPVGGIHGAGACGNRVFFAPANGVCWVDCDFDFAETSDSVSIKHLSLDEDSSGTDYRTGAFETFEDHMLCIAKSKAGTPALCVINGTAPTVAQHPSSPANFHSLNRGRDPSSDLDDHFS